MGVEIIPKVGNSDELNPCRMPSISFSKENTFLFQEDMTTTIKAALQGAGEDHAGT